MSHDIKTLELTIEQAKKSVKLMKDLESLHKNKAFKAVIEQDLFEDHNQNLTFMLADANAEFRNEIHEEQYMIAHFRNYLSSIFQKGRQAEKAILDSEATLEEIRAEGGEE